MNFENTEERNKYIAARGKVILSACPGSGKTTTIAYKLATLIRNWECYCGRYCGVACLSFTNVAKDEIEEKYIRFFGGPIGFPHIVSTIDSFINQYISLPFYHLLQPSIDYRPQIIEDPSFMDEWDLKYYFPRLLKAGGQYSKPVKYEYKPSSIDILLDGSFASGGKIPSLNKKDLSIFNAYCTELKRRQFCSGLLKNSDSTYIALHLIRNYPDIARALITRFPYIVLDEAQDTSEMQYEIFEELIKNGLANIELVGDPYQSLYQWREARPDLFIKRCQSKDWSTLSFTECRRSTQTIVDCYNKLRAAGEPELKSTIVGVEEEPIHVVFFDDFELLLQKYEELAKLYTDRKIVVRGETHLKAMAAFTEYKILWKINPCVPLELLYSKYELAKGSVKNAVNRVRKCLPVLIEPQIAGNYKKKRELLDKISADCSWNARIIELISKLPTLDLTVSKWTELTQKVCKEILDLPCEPVFELKAGGEFRGHHNKVMSDMFVNAKNHGKVTTFHQVKGKTLESIMLVLSENSSGQRISFKDILAPDILSEKQRIIYVGMSRPRWQLVIALPKGGFTEKQVEEIIGGNIVFHVI